MPKKLLLIGMIIISIAIFSVTYGIEGKKTYDVKSNNIASNNKISSNEKDNITKVLENYITKSVQINYKDISGDFGYSLCSHDLIKDLNNQKFKEGIAPFANKYKVILKVSNIEVKDIKIIDNTINRVTVKGTYDKIFINGTDEFLKQYNLVLNKNYNVGYEIIVIKENGKWKVDSYSYQNNALSNH